MERNVLKLSFFYKMKNYYKIRNINLNQIFKLKQYLKNEYNFRTLVSLLRYEAFR